jgi:hypothetical protein
MDAKEPVTVLLGYVVVAFYVYLVAESSEDITQLVGAAVVGGACMAVLGVLQAIGKDPLLLEGVQRISHSSEEPEYKMEYLMPSESPITQKVYVIDDGDHSTMLLAEEY